MKSLLIKWHFHWFKHHLKWTCSYMDIDDEARASVHFRKFLRHNRYLCKNAMDLLNSYQAELLAKAFPPK